MNVLEFEVTNLWLSEVFIYMESLFHSSQKYSENEYKK
jgi:hypothetical protein